MFTQVTVTRDYDLATGAAPTGTVYFTLSAWLVNTVTVPPVMVAAPLDVAGQISIALFANTDPATVPTGSYYTVREVITGQPTRSYRIIVPHNLGPTVGLTTLAAAYPSVPAALPGAGGYGTSGYGTSGYGGYGALVFTRATSPARTLVHDQTGTLLATFTDGARTVTLAGAQRTFTEQKDGFTDQFDRTLATGWGQSPGGGVWGDFNGSASDYSVSSGRGRIATPSVNVSRYVRLNDVVSTYDVRVLVTTSTTPAGDANSFSVIGGFTDTSNHYRYRLTFNSTGSVQAAITRNVAGSETVLAGSTTVAASGYVGGQLWRIRAGFDGTTHTMRAWRDGDPEPGSPTLSVTDTTFPTGKLGVRAFASAAATNAPEFQVDDYQVTAAWPTPPTVTHSTWVQLLATPFAGTVDETWLSTALAATTDVLSVGMEYITGGSKEAEYGPLYAPGRSFDVSHADDGTRQEGSDWNDYLGVTGNYPDLATPTTDPAESYQLGCLDCSGFVRTVFGYRGGMPMCLDSAVDFNGLRIPRRSVDQSSGGPGVTVVLSTGAPPADLSQLLPGDVLYFDADTSNPTEEEGQIDHTGIYLGVDSTGKRRFLSSRKVANGPTLGALGGASVIDGTGLYARSLRRIRRF